MQTLELVNIFEKRNFDRDEAIQIAKAINGRSGLATKEDLAEVKAELKEGIAELKADIIRIETKVESNQKWLMGLGVTLIGGIIGLFVLITNLSTEIRANSINNQVSQSVQK